MAAIVRVKRRRDEDPADCLLLSCKRVKSDAADHGNKEKDAEDVKSVFKFATTLPQNETNVTKHVREAIRKEKLEKEYKNHTAYRDPSEKSRLQQKAFSTRSRLKVVSKRRALNLDALDETKAGASTVDSESSRQFCLYDVIEDAKVGMSPQPKPATLVTEQAPAAESEVVMCNNVPMVREKVVPPPDKGDYVYDIYYLNDAKFDFRSLENILAIEAANEELIMFDDRGSEDEEVYDDEDDENEETNWRNDYPDEQSQFIGRVREFSDDEDFDAAGYDQFEDQVASMFEQRLQLNDQDFQKYDGDRSPDDKDHAYFEEPQPLGSNQTGSSCSCQPHKTRDGAEVMMEVAKGEKA